MYHIQFVFLAEFQKPVNIEVNRVKDKRVNICTQLVFPYIDSSLQQGFTQSEHELIATAVRRLKKGMPQPYCEGVGSGFNCSERIAGQTVGWGFNPDRIQIGDGVNSVIDIHEQFGDRFRSMLAVDPLIMWIYGGSQ